MNSENIRRIVRQLMASRAELDLEILSTPTGPDREQLTEANIQLIIAESKLVDLA